jgi:hypothetical protein
MLASELFILADPSTTDMQPRRFQRTCAEALRPTSPEEGKKRAKHAYFGQAIEMALGGDTVALRLCLERIYPPRKDRPVTFALAPITSARDAADISAAVAAAVSNGDITLSEAAEVAKLIDAYVRSYKVAELDDRVARVEQMTDAELFRIAAGGRDEPDRASKLLLLNPR